MKTYLFSALVSAAMGVVAALVVHFAFFRPADDGRAPAASEEHAPKKAPIGGEDWARMRNDVQALRAEVAAARESTKVC
ncbi:MAG: hypothetical protein MUC63_06860 [Planctomycetes bacterium]|jgi:hypothetical protein|nr:hypothetical protein [Planctomycetota bacterium]